MIDDEKIYRFGVVLCIATLGLWLVECISRYAVNLNATNLFYP